MFSPSSPSPLLLGISGPSSSGKTTLSRLLRDILPPQSSFILHLDDFYLTDAQIPLKDGIQDWDCLESLDLPFFQRSLQHIKKYGTAPPDLVSKEDQNAVGESGVSEEEVERYRRRMGQVFKDLGWTAEEVGGGGGAQGHPRRIAIIDGFLLFSEEMREIRELFDIKLFLLTRYETAKKRREARMGYVTIEGFWEDPPGYVDKIVWPNYVKDHKFLFEDGDVDGRLNEEVCSKIGIRGMPREAEGSMGRCLEWAVSALEEEFKSRGKIQS